SVPREIALVAYRTLPVAALPNAALTSLGAALGHGFAVWQCARERRLDQAPSSRVIGIVFRKSPDRMQMLRKNDDCVDRKRVPCTRVSERSAQLIDMVSQKREPAIVGVHREKICAAAGEVASIVRHQ